MSDLPSTNTMEDPTAKSEHHPPSTDHEAHIPSSTDSITKPETSPATDHGVHSPIASDSITKSEPFPATVHESPPPPAPSSTTASAQVLPSCGIPFPLGMYGVGAIGLGGVGLGTSYLGHRAARRENGAVLALLSTWLEKEDITKLGAALAAAGTIFAAFGTLHQVGKKVYSWFISFFTVSIEIESYDKLHREIVCWVKSQVLEPRGPRALTASSENIPQNTSPWEAYNTPKERNDTHVENSVPISLAPIFEKAWFMLERNIYHIRIKTDSKAVIGKITIMCLGRSPQPLKRLLEICREFSDKNSESFTKVWRCQGGDYGPRHSWDSVIMKPHRAPETVYFDEDIKKELFEDIKNYLDPNNRRFYNSRGIPYRRGYLLHGPPGTGKTSLSLALAGHFGLDLYLIHMPTVGSDKALEKLFSALPPRCIVLLEDIDAVGLKRNPSEESEEDDGKDKKSKQQNAIDHASHASLSGLLNILDGVASQEGRIVVMTSNFADDLDEALIRPGRIDMKIFLGHLSPKTAIQIFMGMFAPVHGGVDNTEKLEFSDESVRKLAEEFSKHIPETTFTPAQVQGFLLRHRASAANAVANISKWVADELAKVKEAEDRIEARATAAAASKKLKKLKAPDLKALCEMDPVEAQKKLREFKEELSGKSKKDKTQELDDDSLSESDPEDIKNITRKLEEAKKATSESKLKKDELKKDGLSNGVSVEKNGATAIKQTTKASQDAVLSNGVSEGTENVASGKQNMESAQEDDLQNGVSEETKADTASQQTQK